MAKTLVLIGGDERDEAKNVHLVIDAKRISEGDLVTLQMDAAGFGLSLIQVEVEETFGFEEIEHILELHKR